MQKLRAIFGPLNGGGRPAGEAKAATSFSCYRTIRATGGQAACMGRAGLA